MDIQAPILDRFENPRGHKQPKGYGDYKVYGFSLRLWQLLGIRNLYFNGNGRIAYIPPCKCIPLMDGK
jgi:hypothetical protein